MGKCIRAKISPRVNFAGSDRFFFNRSFYRRVFPLSFFSIFSFFLFFFSFFLLCIPNNRDEEARTSLSFLSSSAHRNERNGNTSVSRIRTFSFFLSFFLSFLPSFLFLLERYRGVIAAGIIRSRETIRAQTLTRSVSRLHLKTVRACLRTKFVAFVPGPLRRKIIPLLRSER